MGNNRNFEITCMESGFNVGTNVETVPSKKSYEP